MTFITQETSLDGASPQEIYTVSYDFNKWYFTSGDEDVIENSVVYKKASISRSTIELKSEKVISTFEVNFPLDSDFLDLWRVTPPSGRVTLLVQRFHRTDELLEKHVVFKGSIVNVAWEEDSAKVTCETASDTLSRTGLRRHYQYGCPHMLYGPACGVDRNNHRSEHEVESIQGIVVVCPSLIGENEADYLGGYIYYQHSTMGTPERISVEKLDTVTGALTLFMVPIGLGVGETLTLFEGCNRTITVCDSRFDNVENFGGQPYMPDKNPFGNNTLF